LQRLRRAKRNATVELEGTSLNLQGPDNGSAGALARSA
jgi:hypothetical protein